MKKILIIIIGLLIGLFVWNKSEGLTNFNLSSWFQNDDKVNNSVIGGVGSPSTDLTFKTINGESILGYGNLNISSDSIINVEELPTEDINSNSIYCLKSYKPEMLLSETCLQLFGGSNPFNVIYAEDLPENIEDIGVNNVENGQIILYYSKSANNLYIYVNEEDATELGELGIESGWTLAIPLLQTMGLNFVFKGVIYDKSEADFTSTEADMYIMYLLFTENNNKYYLYDKEWVELIDSRNINEYLPEEKHLYSYEVRLFGHLGENYNNEYFSIYFKMLSTEYFETATVYVPSNLNFIKKHQCYYVCYGYTTNTNDVYDNELLRVITSIDISSDSIECVVDHLSVDITDSITSVILSGTQIF